MSKISPCLWFNGEAEEAANFYVSLLPDSRINRIQRNPVDGPAGKAGSVLVVEFTLAGQNYMALNGGNFTPRRSPSKLTAPTRPRSIQPKPAANSRRAATATNGHSSWPAPARQTRSRSR